MSAGLPAAPAPDGFLCDPILGAVQHGFGRRGCVPPPGWWAPRQVHGCAVWLRTGTAGANDRGSPGERPEADAVVSDRRGACVGIVTADCLPVLLASDDAGLVAAAHAGWRGLAAGVLAECVAAMARCGAAPTRLLAAIGPHIGPCCYEIDAPVVDALAPRFGQPPSGAARGEAAGGRDRPSRRPLDHARTATRPGHWRLDLGALARADLAAAGVPVDRIGTRTARCTFCGRGPGDAPALLHGEPRFESHRRDGAGAGRLIHFIVAGPDQGAPPRVGLDTRTRRV